MWVTNPHPWPFSLRNLPLKPFGQRTLAIPRLLWPLAVSWSSSCIWARWRSSTRATRTPWCSTDPMWMPCIESRYMPVPFQAAWRWSPAKAIVNAQFLVRNVHLRSRWSQFTSLYYIYICHTYHTFYPRTDSGCNMNKALHTRRQNYSLATYCVGLASRTPSSPRLSLAWRHNFGHPNVYPSSHHGSHVAASAYVVPSRDRVQGFCLPCCCA